MAIHRTTRPTSASGPTDSVVPFHGLPSPLAGEGGPPGRVRGLSLRPADELQRQDQPVPHLIDRHDVEIARGQPINRLLVDRMRRPLHALMHHRMKLGIVREPLGIGRPDRTQRRADHLTRHQIRYHRLHAKQRAIAIDVMGIVDASWRSTMARGVGIKFLQS